MEDGSQNLDDVDQTIAVSTRESDHQRPHKRKPIFPSIKRKNRIHIRSRFPKLDLARRFVWNRTGPKRLERAETNILEILKSRFHGEYISVCKNTQKIWTISANLTSTNIPLVLVHGFAGGVALWSLNLDQLCANRPVYAIDLPGFARSSRPVFSLDPMIAEKQLVDMLEEWRIEIGLNQEFILLGHSFGGFLSASYAINYPKYVKQLVLIDPWGFSQKPDDIWKTGRLQTIPVWLRYFSSVITKLSPMTGLRVAGPGGALLVKYFRSDMKTKFAHLFDDDRILTYIYHCNVQIPTGEQAFRTISDSFAWAKEPMINRIDLIPEQIPLYFLHGENSWITTDSSISIQKNRPNVFVENVQNAGHHIYADRPEEFNQYLENILFNKD